MEYRYLMNCVGVPRRMLDNLNHIIDNSREIKRETFLSHVSTPDLHALEKELGYDTDKRFGLTMKEDYMVSYHKSKTLSGKIVYYFDHSLIEYIFTQVPNIL